MAQIETAKISSKGQIVIPLRFRGKYKEGDNLLVIENGDQLILKKETAMDKNLLEDMEFARRTEEAWKEIEAGKGIRRTTDEFLKEMESW